MAAPLVRFLLLCACASLGLPSVLAAAGEGTEHLSVRGRELESVSLFGKERPRIPLARDYPKAALDRPRNFSDYNAYQIQWADPFKYEKLEVIGHGTYADVYLGHLRGNASHKVVIKQLKHATWYKIKREVLIMLAVQDHPNIITLLDVVPNLRNQKNEEAPPMSRSLTRRSVPRATLSQPCSSAGFEAAESSGEQEGAPGMQGVHSSSHHSCVEAGTTQEGNKTTGSRRLSSMWGGVGRSRKAKGKRMVERKLHTHHRLKGPGDMEPNLLSFVRGLVEGGGDNKGWFLDYQRPVSLVLDAVRTTPYEVLVSKYSLDVARTYTRQLVEALEHAHSQGIMHRDVKTSNSFVDSHQKTHFLGDWGLGEFYFPKQAYKYSVSTRAYKAPELLLKYTRYTYAIDMWGVGMHLASYAFQRKQIFGYASDERGMLLSQAKVLGTSGLKKLGEKYGMQLPDPPIPNYPKAPWDKAYSLKPGLATPECMDFIDRLLQWDPEDRMTASEALQHPFLAGKPLSTYHPRTPPHEGLHMFG